MATPIIITNLAVENISSLPSKCFESETLSFELHATGFGFVQNEAFKRIEVARPRRLSQHLYRVAVARVPTEPNAIGTEVDILRMILTCQRRGDETHNMHPRPAAVAR